MVRHRFLSPALAVLAVFACLPALLFLLAYPGGRGVLVLLAKVSGFLAFGTLATVIILGTRMMFLERRLGGLDAMYLVHHVFGMAAVVFMSLHPLFLAAAYWRFRAWDAFFLPWVSLGNAAGGIALALAIVLVVLSVCSWLPYQSWLATHRGMGAVLVLSIAHTLAVGRSVDGLVRVAVILYGAVAVAAYVYKVAAYRHVGPRRRGTISSVSAADDVVRLTIELSRPFPSLRPGQFLYLSVRGGAVPPESHPFSVVGSTDRSLSLAAKRSGDYTAGLKLAKEGDPVVLYGPYGGMHRHYVGSDRPHIWIAGGIGITPFRSLWEDAVTSGTARGVLLVWSVRDRKEAFLDSELATRNREGLTYRLWESRSDGRLTAQGVAALAPFSLDGADVMLCGPDAMMYELSHQFIALGVPASRIYYETFSYRD